MELNRPLATVTPTVDGDVLSVLAKHDATFTVGDLHRVLPRYSTGGIRKVLNRLTRQGVVQSDKIGGAYAYRLNADHLAAAHIVGLARLREDFLERLEDRLKSWPVAPVYAAVFGSAARGSMTADSDVDLLLIRPDGVDDAVWEKQRDDLVDDVTRWTGNDTRPLEFTVAEVAERGADEPVLRDVLDEGLTVAGSRGWLTTRLYRAGSPGAEPIGDR